MHSIILIQIINKLKAETIIKVKVTKTCKCASSGLKWFEKHPLLLSRLQKRRFTVEFVLRVVG